MVYRLIEGLEEEYINAVSDNIRGELADIFVFVLTSFLVALRGEEILKIFLGETMEYSEEVENNQKHGHVVLPFRGRFKGENEDGNHFVAVSLLTDSRLRLGS